jgi:hypothetical protein
LSELDRAYFLQQQHVKIVVVGVVEVQRRAGFSGGFFLGFHALSIKKKADNHNQVIVCLLAVFMLF